MSFAAAERLAQTLLYEGYVLYPYRASSLKNRQRWPLGALYPPDFCAQGHGDASALQSEHVVTGRAASVRGAVRFLQLVQQAEAEPAREPSADRYPDADTGAGADAGTREQVPGWHEAIERRIEIEPLALADLTIGAVTIELEVEALRARVSVSAVEPRAGVYRLRVVVENLSECESDNERAELLPRTLASTHVLLQCSGGRFISLLEPPDELQAETAVCAQIGCFPILVGEPDADDVMLSSPIILYDRPRIASESAGDFYDATEIDEMLTLRVLTLSAQERIEAMRTDPRARRLLERTEALGPAALLELHGARRPPDLLTAGTRVRIAPRRGGDVLDLALAGELATIAKVEQDYEGRFWYAVTVDCDPGRDLGLQGQPGHRFFFHRDELEPAP
jgi:hypothetical protein